ncbi:MAG TPA: hypothetical protein DCM28_21000 [Phycisphaerales bacterium]|nr:hypothetical protein [Phycisphaerales bacterium]HCD32415.1 hypothetical protein [Phycisphaerales bacterium]
MSRLAKRCVVIISIFMTNLFISSMPLNAQQGADSVSVGDTWIAASNLRLDYKPLPTRNWWVFDVQYRDGINASWESISRFRVLGKIIDKQKQEADRKATGLFYPFQETLVTQIQTQGGQDTAVMSCTLKRDQWQMRLRLTLLAQEQVLILEKVDASDPSLSICTNFNMDVKLLQAIHDQSVTPGRYAGVSARDYRETNLTVKSHRFVTLYNLLLPRHMSFHWLSNQPITTPRRLMLVKGGWKTLTCDGEFSLSLGGAIDGDSVNEIAKFIEQKHREILVTYQTISQP